MFWILLENYLYARIVFHVSLNFDPVKEILKIRCQIYILIKKVIILRKIQRTMKKLCCREVDAMLIGSAKMKGKHLAFQVLWATSQLLVTHISLIYLADEYFFLFLV